MVHGQSFSTKRVAKLDASGPHPEDEDPYTPGKFRKQSWKVAFVFRYWKRTQTGTAIRGAI